MKNNKIQWVLCLIISVFCWSNVFGESEKILTDSICWNYQIEVAAEPTTLHMDIYNMTDFGPYTPDVVEWYSPDWEINFGSSATIVYELDVNFPPSFEMTICADYEVDGETCTACEVVVVADVNPCEYEMYIETNELFVYAGILNTVDFSAPTDVTWILEGGGGVISNDSILFYDFDEPGNYLICAEYEDTVLNCEGVLCDSISLDWTPLCPEVEILYTPINDSLGMFEAVGMGQYELDDMTWRVNGQTVGGPNVSNVFDIQPGHNEVCLNAVAVDTLDSTFCPVDVCTEVYVPTDTICNYELELLADGADVLAYVFNPDIPNSIGLEVVWTAVGADTIIYTEETVIIQFGASGTYTICAEYIDLTGCSGTLCNEITVTTNTNNCEGIDFEYEIQGNWGIFNLFYPDIYELDEDSTAWYVNGQFIEHVGLFDYNFPNLGYTYEVCAVVWAFHLGTETWCEIEVCHEVPIFCPAPTVAYEPVNDSMFIFNASLQAAPYQLGDVSWYIVENGDAMQGNPVSYVFSESGTYTICPIVSVIDQGGNWLCTNENTCFSLTVETDTTSNCEASFEWQDNGNVNGANTVTFTSTSNGNYTHMWDFDDGTISTYEGVNSFEYVYENTGVYNVCLTVWDYNGCEDTHCELVLVSGTPNAECDYEIDYEVIADGLYFFALTSSTGLSGGNTEWFNLETGEVYGTGDSTIVLLNTYGAYQICASYETADCEETICTILTINNPACEDTDCVFPGDTDYNMVVDNYDVLPLGLHFGETGFVRPDATIDWYGQPAPDWQVTADSVNLKHVDCNGDGQIFFDDIDAIEQNYNRTHDGTNVTKQTQGAPGLHLEFDLDTIYATPDTGTIIINADIIMGTIDLPVDDLYGLAFSVAYPADLVDSNSVAADYFMGSWMGNPNTVLQLEKNVANESIIDFAYSRTDQQNISGFGQIGTVSFVMTDNIIGKLASETELHFPITNIRAINNTGTEIVVSGSDNVVVVDLGDTSTATEQPDLSQNIKIFPNPTSNTINMTISDLQAQTVVLYNSVGQRVLARQVVGTNTQIDVSQLPSGVYVISVQTDQGTHNQKIIIE